MRWWGPCVCLYACVCVSMYKFDKHHPFPSKTSTHIHAGLSHHMRRAFTAWCHKPPRSLSSRLARYAAKEASSLLRDILTLSFSSSSHQQQMEGSEGEGAGERSSRTRHRTVRSNVREKEFVCGVRCALPLYHIMWGHGRLSQTVWEAHA